MIKFLAKPLLIISFALLAVGVVNGMPITNRTPRSHSLDAQTHRAEHQAVVQDRLDAVKLKVCQNRQNAITKIMGNIVQRGTNQIDVFGTIATRVEQFYVDKGKTLDNYDDLVEAVETAKTKAQTDLATMASAGTTFDCDGDNPKGLASSFLDNLKLEISDLKAYRTAIKNLIVGVKSVESTSPGNDDTNNSDNEVSQ